MAEASDHMGSVTTHLSFFKPSTVECRRLIGETRCVMHIVAEIAGAFRVDRLHVAEALSYRRIAPGR